MGSLIFYVLWISDRSVAILAQVGSNSLSSTFPRGSLNQAMPQSWLELERSYEKQLQDAHGSQWRMVHGISSSSGAFNCTKCFRSKTLSSLCSVWEHVQSQQHKNRINDDAYESDPLKDIPSSQRSYAEVQDGWARCVLCDRVWTEDHTTSTRHISRVQHPEAYGCVPPPPPHHPSKKTKNKIPLSYRK